MNTSQGAGLCCVCLLQRGVWASCNAKRMRRKSQGALAGCSRACCTPACCSGGWLALWHLPHTRSLLGTVGAESAPAPLLPKPAQPRCIHCRPGCAPLLSCIACPKSSSCQLPYSPILPSHCCTAAAQSSTCTASPALSPLPSPFATLLLPATCPPAWPPCCCLPPLPVLPGWPAAMKEFVELFVEPKFQSYGSSLKLLMVAEGDAHVYPR